MALKHAKVSAIADGGDTTLVRPSDWNADHTVDAAGLTVLNATSEPSTPASGYISVYGKTIAGGGFLKYMNAAGEDTLVQPHIGQDKVVWFTALGNATTAIQAWGSPALTVVGTATARNWASTSLVTRMKRLGYITTATTAGLLVQMYQGVAQYSVGNGSGLGGFFSVCRFNVSDAATVAGARMFVGMSSSVAAATNVEPNTLTNSVGVAALSTSSNLNIVYGGSASQTAIDLGVNFPANSLSVDAYELVLYAPSNVNNVVGYKVTRLGTSYVAEGTLTAATPGTQLPLNTTALAYRLWRCNNATALACAMDFTSLYIGTDY